jgi:excisionase family DNA binding protein
MNTVTLERAAAAPPTDAEVDDIVATLRAWPYVEPDHRVKLRAAVAGLPLIEHPPAPKLTPIDPPLRIKDVAELLRVSTGTVRRLLHEGLIEGYTLSGRPGSEWRIPESSVRAYLERIGQAR